MSAEAEYNEPGLSNAKGETGEIAVGGDEAKAVEPTAVKEIHRVDDQRDIGGVLALDERELLDRLKSEGRMGFHPAFQASIREIPIDAPKARLAEIANMLEQTASEARGDVFSVDQDRQTPGIPSSWSAQ